MTDLDSRLHALRHEPQPHGAGPSELRRRAARRMRRRHRTTLAAVVPILVLAAIVGVALLDDEPAGQVRTGPGPSSRDASSSTSVDPSGSTAPRTDPPGGEAGQRSLGGVDGVTVEVSPRTDLRDGDLVDVRIEGLEQMPAASILMCRGDITEDNAASACDTTAVQPATGGDGTLVPATEVQNVSLGRTLAVAVDSPDPNGSRLYDCATEPPGCVLAVGPYELPPRVVLVPVSFADEPLPEATLSLSPAGDLQDGQEVTVTADGLRPNNAVTLSLCVAVPAEDCEVLESSTVTARTDSQGVASAVVTVRAAIYPYYGPVDCTQVDCAVAVRTPSYARLASASIRFADDVVAPTPTLVLDPPGPYVDDQEITVRGSGFPPGVNMGRNLGQCPADKDTAVEERCSYAFTEALVADDGTFTMTRRLSDALAFTGSCVTGPGCVLGWVILHGTTVAKVPLEFRS